jgi:hypothetical protein
MKRPTHSGRNIIFLILIMLIVGAVVSAQTPPQFIPPSPRSNYQETNVNSNNRVFMVYATCDGNHEGHDSFMGKALDHFLTKRYPKFIVSSMSPWGRHDYSVERCQRRIGYILITQNPDAEPKPRPGTPSKETNTQTTNRLNQSQGLTAHRQ